MKKIMSKLGLATIICLSFILSEKTTTVVKEMDEIMTKIKEVEQSYYVEPENATIKNDEIIPGLNGKKINIKKSYDEMKKIGTFNEKYLIYDEIKPEQRLKENYDKIIIGGNKKKNTISLIFTVYENEDITQIQKILKEKNINATFFIDGKWLENNNKLAIDLIKQGHTIGNLSNNKDYQNEEFIWINNILKTIGKQKINYCYDTNKDENLKICALQKNYTIKPDIIIKENPLIEIKKQIKPGSLISLDINNKTNEQLELIINYIKSKGYNMENLTNHLSEKNNN